MSKSLTNRLEYLIFIAFSKLFCLLGLKYARYFAKPIAVFFFSILRIRRKVVIKNLSIAFPHLTQKETIRLAFKNYLSTAITLVEILCLPGMTAEQLKKQVKVTNPEFIREKHAEGKGLILMTGHFANWEFCALGVALQIGIPLSVVVKQQSNPLVNEFMNNFRSRWNNKLVPLGTSIRNLYKELKDKNIIAMVGDQRGPNDGMRVNFFGRSSAIYAGPAAIALKTGAPLLFGVMIRNDDYTYTFSMEEVSRESLPDDPEKQVEVMSQRHTDLLEQSIRKNPELWLWMHNRWKY